MIEITPNNIWNNWLFSHMHNRSVVYLWSLPLDLLFWIRIFRHTNGLLISWKVWISKQLSGLQTLFQESLEVLISKLDRVLDGAQRCLLVSRHAVSDCRVKSICMNPCLKYR